MERRCRVHDGGPEDDEQVTDARYGDEYGTRGPSRSPRAPAWGWTGRSEQIAEESLQLDDVAHGDIKEKVIPDSEGRKRLVQHGSYERSRKNRELAIRYTARCAKSAASISMRPTAVTTQIATLIPIQCTNGIMWPCRR